jgi:hypothetical protein
MRHPSTLALLLLAALGLGYVLAVSRGRDADASPVEFQGDTTYIVHNEAGTRLTVWSFQSGEVSRMTEYEVTPADEGTGRLRRVVYTTAPPK